MNYSCDGFVAGRSSRGTAHRSPVSAAVFKAEEDPKGLAPGESDVLMYSRGLNNYQWYTVPQTEPSTQSPL